MHIAYGWDPEMLVPTHSSPTAPRHAWPLIRESVGEWLLIGSGLQVDDVASWAVHPGGPRILSSVERVVTARREASEASRRIVARFANMSSATVLFAFRKPQGLDAPWPCVALAFGPALAVEAALID
jgi:predicted naringenin-chalcone synthase